jgi:alpha-tubulin suppressor-like RCC1 family protein
MRSRSSFRRSPCTRLRYALGRRLASALAPILVAAALGCREDAESPSAPATEPALATTAASALAFRQISTNGFNSSDADHTCAVTTDNRAYCWGSNQDGELGIGTNSGPDDCFGAPCSKRPVAIHGGLRFDHVSVGVGFSCGITTDDRAFCWGRNFEGELGNGSQTASFTPVRAGGSRHFRQIRAGTEHTCAIDTDHVAFCWGPNFDGELGDGTTTQRLSPVRVARGLSWKQLNAGFAHTCGVTTDDHAYCWGSNGNGRLGDGTTVSRPKPAAVAGGLSFDQIDAGLSHSCGVTTAGQAYCWGLNSSGELGDSTRVSRLTPTLVFGRRLYDHVSTGGAAFTCGVTRAGRGVCWGNNVSGELGTGRTAPRLIPTNLAVDLTLRAVNAGYVSTCAVTTSNQAYCWGDNTFGQLGDGTTTGRLVPTPVAGPS